MWRTAATWRPRRTARSSRPAACGTPTGWPRGSRGARAPGRLPLVLGGDCTITLGALDGFGGGGLVYFDGDADLTTPERSASAVTDTMGMTHMLGGGSRPPGRRRSRSPPPLLRPGQVVLFGFDPAELDTGEWTELVSRHLYAAPAPAVRADPAGEARRARGQPVTHPGTAPG